MLLGADARFSKIKIALMALPAGTQNWTKYSAITKLGGKQTFAGLCSNCS
jgi:hypothetical protein